MKTEIYSNSIGSAPEILRNGGLVVVPTETVYGLACNGLCEDSVKKIYEIKGRPEVKPLSLMVTGPECFDKYCVDVPVAAFALAEKFWPGPLTIVLKSRDIVPAIVRAGGETVGLRCPDCDLTLECLRLAGVPFAAPSANPSGSPSPKTAGEVIRYFDGQIDAVIDGGPCELGFESTIIDLSSKPYRILRKGALDTEKIVKAIIDSVRIIGITGPSGAGKSSALEAVRRCNGLIIDCDKVYHELLESSTGMLSEMKERFPDAFESGRIDRRKLAEIVFSDPDSLVILNKITHMYVADEVKSKIREFALMGGGIAAVDAVELISSGLGDICDVTVAVTAEPDIRIRRIMERDGINYEQAYSRISAQQTDDYYSANCDIVVTNNSNMDDFINRFNREVLNYGQ